MKKINFKTKTTYYFYRKTKRERRQIEIIKRNMKLFKENDDIYI